MAIIYPPSGGKIYGDTKVYPPSGGKIYPGTAYPSGVNPAWPFTDIDLPDFLWRPDLTGDYTNVGSDGAALNLTPAPGTPLGSFNQGWVISNPTLNESSVVSTPYNPDVSDLGSVFTVIIKFKPNYQSALYITAPVNIWCEYTGGDQPYYTEFFISVGDLAGNTLNKYSTLIPQTGVEYILMITFNNGVLRLFINGVEDALNENPDNPSVGTPTFAGDDAGNGLWIGDGAFYPDNPSADSTVIMLDAVAKGRDYSAQAAEITAGLS